MIEQKFAKALEPIYALLGQQLPKHDNLQDFPELNTTVQKDCKRTSGDTYPENTPTSKQAICKDGDMHMANRSHE